MSQPARGSFCGMKPYSFENLLNRFLSPFERFTRRASAGGLVLIGTTLITLLLAHSPWGPAIGHLWEASVTISVGTSFRLEKSLHGWVNDGLMALFFLVVGLELKREMLVGELASLKDAALPIIAAAGGMIFPALIFLSFNAGTPLSAGWAIPTATDIAFAIGILVLLGSRVPTNLILFLTALAIADDLGAVVIIAFFYTHDLHTHALFSVAGWMLLLVVLNRGGIRHPIPYTIVGLLLWYAVMQSGVHATIAGILLAWAIPSRPAVGGRQLGETLASRHAAHARQPLAADADAFQDANVEAFAGDLARAALAAQSPLQRIEQALNPWVTFAILPIFAFANAGIDFRGISWNESLTAPLTLGVAFGLVFGKFLGISLFSWAAIKVGLARLPSGVAWRHLLGAAWLGGIGFTMSLFISQLAFSKPTLVEQAKLGILGASTVAAAMGLLWLYLAAAKPRAD